MKVTFQADADLNHVIVLAAMRREPGIDIRSAVDAELSGLSDLEVLALSARERRILITHDKKTMPTHFGTFIQHTQSPGLFIVPQALAISRVVDDLLLVWEATSPEEWTNRIFYLPI